MGGGDQVVRVADGAPTAGREAGAVLERVRERTGRQTVHVHAVGLYAGEGDFHVDRPEVPGPLAVEFLRALSGETGGVFVRND